MMSHLSKLFNDHLVRQISRPLIKVLLFAFPQTVWKFGSVLSVWSNDTGQRARDENHLQHERSQQQPAGKQSKRAAICVSSQMLLMLKMRLTFSAR